MELALRTRALESISVVFGVSDCQMACDRVDLQTREWKAINMLIFPYLQSNAQYNGEAICLEPFCNPSAQNIQTTK